MDCTEARDHLLDNRRGTLPAGLAARVSAHLLVCEACRHEDAADRELEVALHKRLPELRAPESLRSAIEKRVARGARPAGPRLRAWSMVSLGAALALVAAFVLAKARESDVMVTEALNDHLRVLYSAHPLDVEGGGVHRVKPWFEGKVDFAPVVAFGGDDDFPLTGGAVAYFIDRKAAAYIYERRLHVITLLVYRAEGLPWSGVPAVTLGHVRAAQRTTHGFNVLTWRDGDLGYSLVSDLNQAELIALGAKIAGG